MNLEKLQRIQKLEAPPFLLTRIRQKIEESKRERIQPSAAVALVFTFALLLIANAYVLMHFDLNTSAIGTVADSINLITNNSLYE